MNEIDAGDCSGLTMEEIKTRLKIAITCKTLVTIGYHHRFPRELQNRDRDKFFYRLYKTQIKSGCCLFFIPSDIPMVKAMR